MIPTAPQPRRAFQGWRYLETKDAPADFGDAADGDFPPELARRLREAGAPGERRQTGQLSISRALPSRAADEHAAPGVPTGPGPSARQVVGAAHLEVVDRAEAGLGQRRLAPRFDRLDTGAPARSASAAARSAAFSRGGDAALVRRQVAVARGEREAVGLAHRRRAEDLHRQVEVARHALDHQQLLVVLLAEDRDVGRGIG